MKLPQLPSSDAVLSCAAGAALAFALVAVVAFAVLRPAVEGGAS